ncbi:MAG TPA: hypothetical protein VGM05_14875 [Planctomycetaceae bacterium]
MHLGSPIRVDATKILSRRELAAVLADLAGKAPRSANTWLNLILVRLSCCCGLRVSEIAGLRLSDVRLDPSRPHLRIRQGASKGGRPPHGPAVVGLRNAGRSEAVEGRAASSGRHA